MAKAQLVTKGELAKIERENNPVVSKARALNITSPKKENDAYEILKAIKVRLKIIEDKRTPITGPLNQSLHEVNALFKPLSTPLKEADTIIRGKIRHFREEQNKLAAKEEERRRKIQASHEVRGHETKELVPVEAETGRSVTQKRWTFEIVDVNKIPAAYMIPDEVAIGRAVKEGTRKITGVRIFQKETISVR